MKKSKDQKRILNNKEAIELNEFLLLDSKKQNEQIKETLDKIYENTVDVSPKQIDKVLNIAFDPRDNEVYLPNGLQVAKEGKKLIFSFKKKNNLGLIIAFLLAFLFIGGFATYTGVQYLSKAQLNQDLDGDGIADLNIDLDDDGICDINCDTNKDGKPDLNIDYHGNRKAIFNILNEDNKILNAVNQDTNNDGVCDINCDTNKDGWPDLNIDYDGDGIVDLDRDIDGDGIKDLDIDFNGDGICDLNCDNKPKDNICDYNCTNIELQNNGNGTSSSIGSGAADVSTADLIVIFKATEAINATNIYPDDQKEEGVNTTIPDMVFSVQNTTDHVIYYDIDWFDVNNTFITDNFWFKVASDNGYKQGWSAAPKENGKMASKVAIEPNTTHNYTVSFVLHGTNEEQNEDQGKIFKAKIQVDLVKEN